MVRVGRACPQPGARSGVRLRRRYGLGDSGHGIRAHRDRDPRRRADRRGRPAGRPGTPDHPPGRRRGGGHDAHPAAPAGARGGAAADRSSARTRPAPEARGAGPPVELPPAEPEPGLVFETPPPSAGRLVRLRSRLARSQSSLGRGLLTVLAREKLTEDDWEEVEETLLAADVGVAATTQIVERLRTQSMVLATASGTRAARAAGRASSPPSSGPTWTARWAPTGTTGGPASSWSSASTAPARRRRSARSPGCSSATARASSSVPPTPSAPRPPISWRPGASGSACSPCAAGRAATRRRSPSRRCAPAWRARSTPSSSTPPGGCTPSRA